MRTKQFNYLGSILLEKNKIEKEITAKIHFGYKCLYGLTKFLESRSLFKDFKIQLYITTRNYF